MKRLGVLKIFGNGMLKIELFRVYSVRRIGEEQLYLLHIRKAKKKKKKKCNKDRIVRENQKIKFCNIGQTLKKLHCL